MSEGNHLWGANFHTCRAQNLFEYNKLREPVPVLTLNVSQNKLKTTNEQKQGAVQTWYGIMDL